MTGLGSFVLAQGSAGLLDYSTRMVLAGTVLLGIAAGIVGAFLLLRKRSLVGDVASHAAVPGLAAAFLLFEINSPGSGRWLPGLLIGAAVSAALAIWLTERVKRIRYIKEDAALAVVLSLSFGLGVCLLTIIQSFPSGNQAHLTDFLFGRAAALIEGDVLTLTCVASGVLIITLAFFKEFAVLSFDEDFAAAQGWPVAKLELLLTALVVVVTVTAMQSVGLLLAVALLITPAVAARFWTDRLPGLVAISAGIGALASASGTIVSAQIPRLGTGALIVVFGLIFFIVSWFFGSKRGLVWAWWERRRGNREIHEADLLRAVYELLEAKNDVEGRPGPERLADLPWSRAAVASSLTWPARRFESILATLLTRGWIWLDADGHYRFTLHGARRAIDVVRRHRLWELYLLNYAALPAGQIDRAADITEHGLTDAEMERLEGLFAARGDQSQVPASFHKIDAREGEPA